MANAKISVLVVEDAPVVLLLLVHVLNADPALEVIGTAGSAEEALQFLAQRKPDVVLMDVHLPHMDGLEATRRIMETQPVPVIVTSATTNSGEVAAAFQALEAGALAFVEKPVGPMHPRFEEMVSKLVDTVKVMSEVRVVKRWSSRAPVPASAMAELRPGTTTPGHRVRMVAIGASTGGPAVLQTILAGLPRGFPVPVLIVQHIASGFLLGMVEWLRRTSRLPVAVAKQGQFPEPGNAYLAPEGAHLEVDEQGRMRLSTAPPDDGLRPSVARLFRSVATVYRAEAVGILLSGMGRDGARELQLMRAAGALTVAQDEESSVVHGMPGEAIRLGAAALVLSPDRIVALLTGTVPSERYAAPFVTGQTAEKGNR
jgi:two-component system chemotaxis response regulator CheB